MGCHTWLYKKSNRTIEEAREIYIKLLEENNDFFNNIIKDKNHDGIDWLDVYPEFTDDNLNRVIAVNERKIRIVKKGLCNVAVFNNQPEVSRYIEGKGFFIDTNEGQPFRKRGYPDDILFSFEETMDYINDPKNNCETWGYTNEGVKKFWDKYPDGMIDFG